MIPSNIQISRDLHLNSPNQDGWFLEPPSSEDSVEQIHQFVKDTSLAFKYPSLINLRKHRVNLVNPYENTGIDYTEHLWVKRNGKLSEFLRRSSMIFIIKGFRTIFFIFIVISIMFRLICPPAFFRCFSNSLTFTKLRTTYFFQSNAYKRYGMSPAGHIAQWLLASVP